MRLVLLVLIGLEFHGVEIDFPSEVSRRHAFFGILRPAALFFAQLFLLLELFIPQGGFFSSDFTGRFWFLSFSLYFLVPPVLHRLRGGRFLGRVPRDARRIEASGFWSVPRRLTAQGKYRDQASSHVILVDTNY